jgi:hypothetical protein
MLTLRDRSPLASIQENVQGHDSEDGTKSKNNEKKVFEKKLKKIDHKKEIKAAQ